MASAGEKNGHSDPRKTPRTHLPSAVANLGETQYPDVYGGLTARLARPDEPAAITMTIYVVAARAEPFLAAIRRQAANSPEVRYTIAHVPHTWAELNALAQQIEDAKDYWRDRGAELSTAEPNAAASKVMVTLLDYHAAAASSMTSAYGHDWISVEPSSARYVPLSKKARRSGGTYSPMAGRRPW